MLHRNFFFKVKFGMRACTIALRNDNAKDEMKVEAENKDKFSPSL